MAKGSRTRARTSSTRLAAAHHHVGLHHRDGDPGLVGGHRHVDARGRRTRVSHRTAQRRSASTTGMTRRRTGPTFARTSIAAVVHTTAAAKTRGAASQSASTRTSVGPAKTHLAGALGSARTGRRVPRRSRRRRSSGGEEGARDSSGTRLWTCLRHPTSFPSIDPIPPRTYIYRTSANASAAIRPALRRRGRTPKSARTPPKAHLRGVPLVPFESTSAAGNFCCVQK